MWSPADLLTDLDVLALDRNALSDFGVSALTDKRRTAVDWLTPRVEQAGYVLAQHRARRAPAAVYGLTSGTYTDYTEEASDTTEDDVPLHDIFATPSTDALYVGLTSPFKGVYAGLTDDVNANTCTLAAKVWTGAWVTVTSLADGTIAATGKSFSGGGLIGWQQPDTWTRRPVNDSDLLYWAKLTLGSTLTAGTVATQVTPVVTSRLTLPAACYALGLLYQEAYGSNRGQWEAKANALFKQADAQLSVALPLIADEFDLDDSDTADATEASSIAAAAAWLSTWERG